MAVMVRVDGDMLHIRVPVLPSYGAITIEPGT